MRAPLVLLLLLASPSAALAHGGGGHVGFVATVSGIEPPIPGLIAQVLGGHERLSVQNLTQKTIVILDVEGRPQLHVAPGEAKSIADPRVGSTGPPPERGEFVRNWRIRGEADGEPFAIVGFLGYRRAVEAADGGGLSLWIPFAVGLVGAGALAALALTLRRRQGES